MFERMLDHPNIDLALGADYHDLKPSELAPLTIYTGPIDAFFGHRFGPLPYRSLQFRHESLAQRRFQEVAVVNYPAEDVPYTRITEYKHLTGPDRAHTSITYEYPSAEGDPYYPIPRPENQVLSRSTRRWRMQRDDVLFLGRLGTYRYYNMDQVVGQALATHRRLPSDAAPAAAPPRRPSRAPSTARPVPRGRPRRFPAGFPPAGLSARRPSPCPTRRRAGPDPPLCVGSAPPTPAAPAARHCALPVEPCARPPEEFPCTVKTPPGSTGRSPPGRPSATSGDARASGPPACPSRSSSPPP
jgi:hypothetical protein